MQTQRPAIESFAHELPGHTVFLADGEEIGTVEGVASTPATDASPARHALLVQMDQPDATGGAQSIVVPDDAVHAVTDDGVVLGTTARWLGQHMVSDEAEPRLPR